MRISDWSSDVCSSDLWRRSTAGKTVDRDGTRERLAVAMNAAIEGEVDRLAEKIGTLATIGAVAPFVGLFGTVWGIMRAFTAIAAMGSASGRERVCQYV